MDQNIINRVDVLREQSIISEQYSKIYGKPIDEIKWLLYNGRISLKNEFDHIVWLNNKINYALNNGLDSNLVDEYRRVLANLDRMYNGYISIDQALIQSTKIANQNKESEKQIKQSEKKIGFNLINIIGIIMIIIGLSIFGKYVYNNYLTDLTKGISLYIISFIFIGVGEFLLSKRNPKFSKGIIGLGIASIFMSTFVNYLFLKNFNSITAIIVALVLSVLTIFYSYKKNSSLIRIIALLGGLISLLPIDMIKEYQYTESIIVITFVLILNIINLCLPIKKQNDKLAEFMNYTLIINSVFFIVSSSFINSDMFPVMIIINYSIAFYISKFLARDNENIVANIVVPIITFVAIVFSMNIIWALVIGIIVMIFFVFTKNNIKWIYYVSSALVFINIIRINTSTEFRFVNVIIVTFLLLMTIYLNTKYQKIILRVVSYIFSLILLFYAVDYQLLEQSIVLISFLGALTMNIKNKDEIDYRVFKNILVVYLIFYITRIIDVLDIYNFDKIIFQLLIMFIIFSFSNINEIKNSKYRNENNVYLIFMLLFSIFGIIMKDIYGFIYLVLIIISVLLFINDKYINLPFIKDTRVVKIFISAVLTILYTLCNNSFLGVIISNIILMIIAVTIVYFGFRYMSALLRKFGIGIVLFTCIKLIIIDMYQLTYMQKAIAFVIVGVLALVISYFYSAIDKKIS